MTDTPDEKTPSKVNIVVQSPRLRALLENAGDRAEAVLEVLRASTITPDTATALGCLHIAARMAATAGITETAFLSMAKAIFTIELAHLNPEGGTVIMLDPEKLPFLDPAPKGGAPS